jgi:hypothetical protein
MVLRIPSVITDQVANLTTPGAAERLAGRTTCHQVHFGVQKKVYEPVSIFGIPEIQV